MRLALLIPILALAGCFDTRTGVDFTPPVYPESPDEVFDGVVTVIHNKFTHLDSADRGSFTVTGTENHFPGGDTAITVTIEAVTAGTQVNVDCQAGPTLSPLWSKNRGDCERFFQWLDEEMLERRALKH